MGASTERIVQHVGSVREHPVGGHGFRRYGMEGVAAAAIERARVCDHRKGDKTPS